jgi:hypothetical protein
MADDQQVRALLTRAAELPDTIQPPVAHLIASARRTRRLRAAGSVAAVVVLVAAAFVLPPALRSLLPTGVTSSSAGDYGARQPTAAQLSHFRWSALARSPLGARSDPLLAWTGRELIELGGTKKGNTQPDGAVFVAATGRWTLVAHVRGNVGFSNAIDVWTGRQLFVTNGQTASCLGGAPVSRCLPRAGLYDLATNRWTTTLLPKPLDSLTLAAAVWTGRDVVIAGTNAAHARLAVAAYTPATRHWRMITPRLPRRHPPLSAAMAATPTRVLLWSLWARDIATKDGGTIRSGIDVLALGATGRWSNVTGNWPQGRSVDGPVYASGKVLIPPAQIWCGTCPHPFGDSPARLADAATLSLTTIPADPLVTQPLIEPPIWLWTGRTALAATLDTSASSKTAPDGRLTRLAAYDPLTRRWHVLPSPPGRPPLGAGPILAGDRLLVLTLDGSLLSLHR